MIKHSLPVAAAALALGVLTGCVDDKYDLSDIDQTVQVAVNDLTIPLNVDAVTLSTLFDLDENDPDAIVKVVDGVYAIEKRGSYSSSDLSIEFKSVSGFNGPSVTATVQTGGATIPSGQKVSFPFTLPEATFGSTWNSVPSEVLGIRKLYGDFTIQLSIGFTGAQNIGKFTLKDLVLTLPKGLVATSPQGTFYPETSTLVVPEAVSDNGTVVITLDGTALDFPANGFDAATHTATYEAGISVKEGTIEISS
ncbi:MAG: hypothetical protein K2H87_00870, partial [Duncaniella sp.]|nr:hypothetical protein [Duncaniella sp.]